MRDRKNRWSWWKVNRQEIQEDSITRKGRVRQLLHHWKYWNKNNSCNQNHWQVGTDLTKNKTQSNKYFIFSYSMKSNYIRPFIIKMSSSSIITLRIRKMSTSSSNYVKTSHLMRSSEPDNTLPLPKSSPSF